jgi:alpha-beta hydrolase superfamily lysophospholipase
LATVDERTFVDDDGVEVFFRRWLPEGDPRAVVLIAHGLCEHSGRYARFADALVAARYAVYAPDHRGHGRTAASTGVGRTGPRGMDGILGDLHQLVEARGVEAGGRDTGDRPVVLFGHSMGALLAQAYAERHGDRLTALVLSGSPGANDKLGEAIPALRAAADAGLGDEPLDALGGMNGSFGPARTKFDWLSRDADEVDAYVADPMCGTNAPSTYRFIADLMQLGFDTMQPASIAGMPPRLPVLLVTGERDIASNDAAHVHELETRLRAHDLDVDARYYPDARHEVLNELNRDEVTADIIDWLDRHLPHAG